MNQRDVIWRQETTKPVVEHDMFEIAQVEKKILKDIIMREENLKINIA